jgi:hypothetical protein
MFQRSLASLSIPSLVASVTTLTAVRPPQVPEREIAAVPAPPKSDDVRALSVTELFARMPDELRCRDSAGKWSLAPVPQELRRRAESKELSDDDWRAVFRLADVIHLRPRWPLDEPLRAWIREPQWLAPTRITARAIDPPLGTIEANNLYPSWCGNCRMDEMFLQRLLRLDELPSATTRIVFEVTVDHLDQNARFFAPRPDPRLIWRGNVEVKIHAAKDPDRVLPPIERAAVDEAVCKTIRGWWTKPTDRSAPKLFVMAGDAFERAPDLRGVGLSLRVELRHDGTLVQKRQLIADHDPGFDRSTHGLIGFACFDAVPIELSKDATCRTGWVLSVTGTPDDLLVVWEAESWWKGSFVVSLADTLANLDRK